MRTFLAWLRGWRGRHRERWGLVFEHLALLHQVWILQRSGTHRPRLTPWDRLFWLILSRLWPRWRGSLIIIQPGTVLKWRRQGLSLVFGRGHDGRWRGGRPRIDAEVRELIAHMARVNLLWGAPRIHGELLKLGFTVSEATVSRYLRRFPRPRSQGWATFVRNHLLLVPDRFDSVPEHRHHLGGDHLDRTAAFPTSERRSPERGGPMRPVFQQPEARMRDVSITGLKGRARGYSRNLGLCLPSRPIADAVRYRVGIAHIRAPPPPAHPVSHAA